MSEALLQTLRIRGSKSLYVMQTKNLPWCLFGFQVLKIFSIETYQADVMDVPFLSYTVQMIYKQTEFLLNTESKSKRYT